eukprot:362304-Chlamydomonas_euryale.AAC.5
MKGPVWLTAGEHVGIAAGLSYIADGLLVPSCLYACLVSPQNEGSNSRHLTIPHATCSTPSGEGEEGEDGKRRGSSKRRACIRAAARNCSSAQSS